MWRPDRLTRRPLRPTQPPGDHHTAAQRALFNQLLGRLHHYPQTRQALQRAHRVPHQRKQPEPTPQRDILTAGDVYIARKNYQAITAPLEAEPAAA
jgi:hypothetical protein